MKKDHSATDFEEFKNLQAKITTPCENDTKKEILAFEENKVQIRSGSL